MPAGTQSLKADQKHQTHPKNFKATGPNLTPADEDFIAMYGGKAWAEKRAREMRRKFGLGGPLFG
jgi:hypothetical protein